MGKLNTREIPDCPSCDTDILVDAYLGAEDEYICRDCGKTISTLFRITGRDSHERQRPTRYHTTINCHYLDNVAGRRISVSYREDALESEICDACESDTGVSFPDSDTDVQVTGGNDNVYHTTICGALSAAHDEAIRTVTLSLLDETYRECALCSLRHDGPESDPEPKPTPTAPSLDHDYDYGQEDSDERADQFWIKSEGASVFHSTQCHSAKATDQPVFLRYSELPAVSRHCFHCRASVKRASGSAISTSDSRGKRDGPHQPCDADELPELSEGQVWEATSGHREKYHTQASCHQLRKANSIRAVGLDILPDAMSECSFCSGNIYTNAGDSISTLAWDLRRSDSFQEALKDD